MCRIFGYLDSMRKLPHHITSHYLDLFDNNSDKNIYTIYYTNSNPRFIFSFEFKAQKKQQILNVGRNFNEISIGKT